MSKIRIILPNGEQPITGKSVSFKAPCDCKEASYVAIGDIDYVIVDIAGNAITGTDGGWVKDAIVSVILDVEERRAYLQASASNAQTIVTINGVQLKFFAGTREEYEALSDAEKENLYAIITDDDTQDQIFESINELTRWKNQQKIYSRDFGVTDLRKGDLLELGVLPSDKTVNDIIGVGLRILFDTGNDSADLSLSTGKTRSGMLDTDVASAVYGKTVVPFLLTASITSTTNAFGMVFMHVYLCSGDSKLYIYFPNGGFTRYYTNTSGALISDAKLLSDNVFYLDQVHYWFA